MIFKVEHSKELIGKLRRKWRKDGRFTMRVTCTGRISVMRMPRHADMKTEAQLKCRARFVQAQQLMLEALKDKKKIRFFQKKRLRQRYKTLRGCMLAYYIDELIYKERQAEREVLGDKMGQMLTAAAKCVGEGLSAVAVEEMESEGVVSVSGCEGNDILWQLAEGDESECWEVPPE